MNRERQWIQSLQKGDLKTLEEVYLQFKGGFLSYARQYPIEMDVVLDIYHDSIIALYENFARKNMNTMKSSLKTYLFAIGKYKILAYLKSNTRQPHISIEEEPAVEFQLFEIDTDEDRLAQLNEALDQLGPICQQMLKLFYYKGLKLEAIQHQMAYESKDTVKSQKSRCLKQLKKLIQSDGNR